MAESRSEARAALMGPAGKSRDFSSLAEKLFRARQTTLLLGIDRLVHAKPLVVKADIRC